LDLGENSFNAKNPNQSRVAEKSKENLDKSLGVFSQGREFFSSKKDVSQDIDDSLGSSLMFNSFVSDSR
jgi:hypothetical protein